MTYSFDEDLATRYGVDEAIMINNLAFWISYNKSNDKHFYDGCYWTYNSRGAFTKIFKFWNERQIRRILDSLVDKGVIIKGNYNKLKKDKTCWYAFINESDIFGQSTRTEMSDVVGQKRPRVSDKKGRPLPDSNNYTDNKPDNKHTDSSDSDKSSSVAHKKIVEFWLKEFHPGWDFKAMQGKALKTLITQIKKILVAHGRLAGDQEVIDFFIKMCQSLPEWFKDKDLPTLSSKFNEIITQISNGKQKQRAFDGTGSKYAN